MARGLERHQQREKQLNDLGRQLARRAKSSCELCDVSGTALRPWEVPPLPDEVSLDNCLLLCDACREGLEKPKKIDPVRWHFLSTAIWSSLPAAQVCALRMLRHLAASGQEQAVRLLEETYVDEAVEAWASS